MSLLGLGLRLRLIKKKVYGGGREEATLMIFRDTSHFSPS